MVPNNPDRPTGPWQTRVRFGPGGAFAYRPGELLVKADVADIANERLLRWAEERRATDESIDLYREEGLVAESFARFRGTFDTREVMEELHSQGIASQVNHVLFATSCCPPHPSDPTAEAFYASLLSANPFYAQSALSANPFYAQSAFSANPFYAQAGWGWGCECGCGCGCGRGPGNSAFLANPFYAQADRSPFADPASRHTGGRSSSARPAADPQVPKRPQVEGAVRVAILDTGWAQADVPSGLPDINVTAHGGDHPDADGDGFLDPAAGHGTFIAGIIEQLTPGCEIEVIEVLSTYGEGDEAEIAGVLGALARRPEEERPQLVNLSFGGYSPLGMAVLAEAISALHDAGSVVVASAGNDGTCIPMFPAALPNVVGVGALDKEGKPARFTNYGPWVRACAPGGDVVSIFFEGFDGAGPPEQNYDPDRFDGWAHWSGTSFAAPAVVAALARAIGQGTAPHDAVVQLVDDQELARKPMLGTIVDPTK